MVKNTSWQDDRIMTPSELRAAVARLGMSYAGAARFLGLSERTVFRMVSGQAVIPDAVILLLRAMIHTGLKPKVPKWQKEPNAKRNSPTPKKP